MIDTANSQKPWGFKAMSTSVFKHLSRVIDLRLENMQEGEFKCFARLAEATLKKAFLDAEEEVLADPDVLGPAQTAFLTKPAGEMLCRVASDDGSDEFLRRGWARSEFYPAPDMVAEFCTILSLDPDFIRTAFSDILDKLADKVRAERSRPSAEIICLESAREQRDARRHDPPVFVFVPVFARKQLVGEQLAWSL